MKEQWWLDKRPIYIAVRDYLRAEWPRTFDHDSPLPLRYGIHRALAVHLDPADVQVFLKFWTLRREYKAQVRLCWFRYRLKGWPVEWNKQRGMP